MTSTDTPPLMPPDAPNSTNEDSTNQTSISTPTAQQPKNITFTANFNLPKQITTVSNTVETPKSDINNANPNLTFASDIVPPQPKISSNFDPPPRQNDKMDDTNVGQQQEPTHFENTQPIPPSPPLKSVPLNTQLIKTAVGNNRDMAPYGSRGNDQGVSKPSFAAAVQAKLPFLNDGTSSIEIRHGTHLGKPTVFFTAQDYFVTLAQDCKLTLIGKFYRGKPTMEELRKVFISQFHLIGSVKIAYLDFRHVYLDFTNEVDYNHILFKEYVDIGEAPMKILKWTTHFKPEEETSIVPVWILIHQLPWHLFR